MASVTTFANHRGVVPLLWAFFGLATLEFVVVHLFVTLTWPWIGWPLSILSLATLVWLIGWIRSWPRLPHELHEDRLVLHMGSLRKMEIPLDVIERIEREPSLARIKELGARKLVVLAHPNRLLLLSRKLDDRRATRTVAIRLDDPAAFDAAMAERGIGQGG